MNDVLYKVVLKAKTSSYPIYVGRGIVKYLPKLMQDLGLRGKCAIVTSKVVSMLYGNYVSDILREGGFTPYVIDVPDGEQCKSFEVLLKLYDELINAGFDRSSTIIALGGGSVGDVAGFVAATYMRGINYVQVPTTFLAQVDAAIGGKAAINHPKGKNLIGVFYQPQLVLIDVDFLKTHGDRDLRSGLAEVVKYGAVLDREFFKYLDEYSSKLLDVGSSELLYAIRRSCEFKASVVERDEFDRVGIRALLNYGHTVGHALESFSNYELRHGEAVSMGMCYEAKISVAMGLARESVVKSLTNLLSKLGLPTEVKLRDEDLDKVIELMKRDKKAVSGRIAMVLLKDIGNGVLVRDVPEAVVREVFKSW